ncbi:binding partner of ACD11 1-like isoform X2 [Lolium perenne]|nr:binding partner of ACD11 1-like isoform X2 [Lolium perenne]XP_051193205.1 binding partner of ACD11 1-like isoform X2 [Lolium perenne]
MASTVKVHNVSLQASERDIKEFFSFSGDIVYVEMQGADERSQFAYITFKSDQEAERAMLLTGATIVDMAIIITPATNYQLPAAVLADLESKTPRAIEAALHKAEDVVGSMLAKGFILGKDALEKAKTFDETHQLTSTATAKVSSIDKSLGLSEKISTGTLVVNEKMKEMDEKYQVAEKTKSALVAAEQTVSTAGSAIMSNRYILTGTAWVTGAYNKVATSATETYNKEKMMADQDAELSKNHLHESSVEAGQCQEGDTAKVHSLESTETVQTAAQEGECPKTSMPEDHDMGKGELKSQNGEMEKAQENTETCREEHKHHEAELPKANTPESVLMAEQTEQEHKHPDTGVAITHNPGSPVTIPVCVATDDGNSSNSPKKPEASQGFI